jgi:hypothetical protein
MAKAILEFDLNDPDDTQAHLRCVKSLDLVLFILKIEGELRSKLKHGQLTDCQYDTLDKFRETFYEEMNERGINIDELIS